MGPADAGPGAVRDNRVLYRPTVVPVTPGSGRVVVIFAALRVKCPRDRSALTSVHGPHHPYFGARSIVDRPHLEIVDEPREQGESHTGGQRLVGQ